MQGNAPKGFAVAFVGGDEVAAGVAVEQKATGGAEEAGDALAVNRTGEGDFPGDGAGLDVQGAKIFDARVLGGAGSFPTAGE